MQEIQHQGLLLHTERCMEMPYTEQLVKILGKVVGGRRKRRRGAR